MASVLCASETTQPTLPIAVFRKEISLRGYSLCVLKSALQKYIRRGDFEKAKFALAELDLFSLSPDARPQDIKRIRTNMIHRLMIIYIEDIGLGDLPLWRRLDGLLVHWLAARDGPRAVEYLVHMVWFMCAANKTRAASHVRGAFRSNLAMWEKQKDKWRHVRHFMAQKDPRAALGRDFTSDYLEIAARWYKEIQNCSEAPLCFLLLLLDRVIDVRMDEHTVAGRTPPICDLKWDLTVPRLEFDDFVYDKHCRGGPSSQRTTTYFKQISSRVNNEVYLMPPVFRQIYDGRILRETSYEFITRCQLVCSAHKTDSYLARAPDGTLLFVKGPFTKFPRFAVNFQAVKRAHGLPTLDIKVEYLYPDRWPDGTPLGVRNALDRKAPRAFIVCKSIFSEDDIKVKLHSSKLWPPTEVLDAAHIAAMQFDPFNLNRAELADYAKTVFLRAEHGVGDLADRNFMRAHGRIYSVDEEQFGAPIDIEKQLKCKRYKLVSDWRANEQQNGN